MEDAHSPSLEQPALADLAAVARLEEQRQARGMAEIADLHVRIAGGTMAKGPAGSWLNAAAGLGFEGPVGPDVVPFLIDWYERDGIEPRVEVAPYAHDTLVQGLAAAGFVVRVFETVFFRSLRSAERAEPAQRCTLDGVEIRAIDPADTAAVRECVTVIATGFTPPGGRPRPQDIETWERCARHPRTTLLGAFLGERCAGAGFVEVAGSTAALFGLSVAEPFRRRGVQQSLIAARLRWAADRGAVLATVSARPGAGTVRNARRMGFQVAYTKVTLVRPGPGLAPVVS